MKYGHVSLLSYLERNRVTQKKKFKNKSKEIKYNKRNPNEKQTGFTKEKNKKIAII